MKGYSGSTHLADVRRRYGYAVDDVRKRTGKKDAVSVGTREIMTKFEGEIEKLQGKIKEIESKAEGASVDARERDKISGQDSKSFAMIRGLTTGVAADSDGSGRLRSLMGRVSDIVAEGIDGKNCVLYVVDASKGTCWTLFPGFSSKPLQQGMLGFAANSNQLIRSSTAICVPIVEPGKVETVTGLLYAETSSATRVKNEQAFNDEQVQFVENIVQILSLILPSYCDAHMLHENVLQIEKATKLAKDEKNELATRCDELEDELKQVHELLELRDRQIEKESQAVASEQKHIEELEYKCAQQESSIDDSLCVLAAARALSRGALDLLQNGRADRDFIHDIISLVVPVMGFQLCIHERAENATWYATNINIEESKSHDALIGISHPAHIAASTNGVTASADGFSVCELGGRCRQLCIPMDVPYYSNIQVILVLNDKEDGSAFREKDKSLLQYFAQEFLSPFVSRRLKDYDLHQQGEEQEQHTQLEGDASDQVVDTSVQLEDNDSSFENESKTSVGNQARAGKSKERKNEGSIPIKVAARPTFETFPTNVYSMRAQQAIFEEEEPQPVSKPFSQVYCNSYEKGLESKASSFVSQAEVDNVSIDDTDRLQIMHTLLLASAQGTYKALAKELDSQCTAFLGNEYTWMCLLDPATNKLMLVSPWKDCVSMETDSGIEGTVLRSGRSMYINNCKNDPRVNHLLESSLNIDIWSTAAVPIYDPTCGAIVGVFVAVNKSFTDTDLKNMESISNISLSPLTRILAARSDEAQVDNVSHDMGGDDGTDTLLAFQQATQLEKDLCLSVCQSTDAEQIDKLLLESPCSISVLVENIVKLVKSVFQQKLEIDRLQTLQDDQRREAYGIIESLKERADQAETEAHAQHRSYEIVVNETQELESLRDKLLCEKQVLLDEAKKSLDEKQDIHNQLELAVVAKQDVEKRFQIALDERNAAIEDKNTAHKMCLSASEACQVAETEVASIHAQLESTQATLESTQKQLFRCETELDATKDELRTLRSSMKESQDSLHLLKAQLSNTQQRNEDLSSKIKERDEQIEAATKQGEYVSWERDTYLAEKQDLETQIHISKESCEDLKRQLATLDADFEEKSNKLLELQDKHSKLKQERVIAKQYRAKTKLKLQNLSQERLILNQKLCESSKAHTALVEEQETLRKELNEKSSKLENLAAELSTTQHDHLTAKSQLEQTQLKLSHIDVLGQTKLERLERSHLDATKELQLKSIQLEQAQQEAQRLDNKLRELSWKEESRLKDYSLLLEKYNRLHTRLENERFLQIPASVDHSSTTASDATLSKPKIDIQGCGSKSFKLSLCDAQTDIILDSAGPKPKKLVKKKRSLPRKSVPTRQRANFR